MSMHRYLISTEHIKKNLGKNTTKNKYNQWKWLKLNTHENEEKKRMFNDTAMNVLESAATIWMNNCCLMMAHILTLFSLFHLVYFI